MASKSTILALLFTVAFVHGTDTSNIKTSNDIVRSDREGRTLVEVSIVGGMYLLSKIAGLIISSALSLLEFKITALAYVSDLATWLIQNYFPVIVGTAVVVGLCFITSAFSAEPVDEFDPRLIHAARSLDQGIVKFGRLI